MRRKDMISFENAWIKIEAWSELPTQFWVFKIKEVNDEDVIIDINHALAGKTLTFDIEIVDIK
jgi:FKBP-type peptidyl-prolyl cis-trans isomerase 2